MYAHTYTSKSPDYFLSKAAESWTTSFSALSKYLFARRRQPHTTIQDLPPELLEQIFIFYAHDHDHSHASEGTPATDVISAHPRHLVNPLVLGHVCSHWMAMSRTLPRIWSSIYVIEPSVKKIEMAAYWLSLSGKSPLTLSLTMGNSASTSSTRDHKDRHSRDKADAARRFVDLFVSHYDQWQHITIQLSQTNYLSSLLGEKGQLLSDHPPAMLKHLDVDYGSWMMGDGPPSDDAIIQLYSAPGLESLAWSAQWYKPTKLVSLVFPHWASLRRLTYRQPYSFNALKVVDAVGLLQACPMLEHFDAMLHAEHGHGHGMEVPEFLTHHHLRVLDVTLEPRTSAFFDSLCLPALEEVSVAFELSFGGAVEYAEPFLGLLERSECRIQKLFFDNRGGPDDTLLEVLASHHLQHLRDLQLAGVLSTSRTIELLTRKDDAPASLSILPNLERLEFQKSVYGEQPSTDAVERMLVSRTKKAIVGVDKQKEDHGRLSAHRHVELSLGALGVWGYYWLAKLPSLENRVILTSTSTSDVCLPQLVQVLNGMRD